MNLARSHHPDFFRFLAPPPRGRRSGIQRRVNRCTWRLAVILVLACGGSGQGLTLSPQPLFDGKDLGQWQTADYLGSGAVRIQDGTIRLERGLEQTGIRWTGSVPSSDYEITLEARRIEGRDFFCGLTFPVGQSFCSLIVGGWGGKTVGLSNIDGLDAAENDTTVLLDFALGKWYPIRLRVTDERIQVWIEGDRIIDADIRERTIGTRPEVELCRPLGIMTWMTTGEVRDIVLWRMGGEPLRLRTADRMAAGEQRDLRQRILADGELEHVAGMARELLKGGFDAGQGYPQVWIRDLNTFIETALQVHEPEVLRSQLLRFFAAQSADGNIPDGLHAAGRAHKNTVETDQETSLIQAVARYVRITGDRTILAERVGGETVLQRMGSALEFLRRHRWNDQHGLIWGATTADWGDVQPKDNPGVDLSDHSHRAVDVYDNAMLAIALRDYLELAGPDAPDREQWAALWRSVRNNVRLYLWTGSKFRPHLYLDGSPWPGEFNEQVIYYQGGTAIAIEAGLLEADEAARSFETMIENRIRAGATSIGLTLYPPYPAGFFQNPQMARPYSYQNGGDWTWFGGRIIRQMIRHGYIEAAYEELRPMVRRVIENEGFYEWYTLDGKPRGSGAFRGSAGVLALAINDLRAWAAAEQSERLSEHVRLVVGPANGTVIEQDDRCLVVYGAPADKVRTAERVLFTHARRDIAEAGRPLVDRGAVAVAPAAEEAFFREPRRFWEDWPQKRFYDFEQQTTKILTEPIPVGRTVNGGDVLDWRGLAIEVVDTPGYTRGAVSYILTVDGVRYGFVGDVIYGQGHLLDLYSLQDAVPDARIGHYHGWAGRMGELIASLRTLRSKGLDVMVPARGPVIHRPVEAIDTLIARLQAVYRNYLSVSAGRWYFREGYDTLARRVLGEEPDVPWMTQAEYVAKPPAWVVPIQNSRLLIGHSRRGFLIDCGGKAIVEEVRRLCEDGTLGGLDGLFITHYHSDHTDAVEELLERFDVPVYAVRPLDDILARPGAYRLPVIARRPLRNLRIVDDGHTMPWDGLRLTFRDFPGQTIYHSALLAEKADERILFVGDSFTPTGMDDYCLQNRNLLHEGMGYLYCLDAVRALPAGTWLINQHVLEPFRFSNAQIDLMERALHERRRLLAEVLPWDDPNYGIDERWVRFYPYGLSLRPGGSGTLQVRVFNHSAREHTWRLRLHGPEGIKVDPEAFELTVPPRTETGHTVHVEAGPAARPVEVLTADVTCDGRTLPHWTEALIEVSPAQNR